jgi:hypothetical protein
VEKMLPERRNRNKERKENIQSQTTVSTIQAAKDMRECQAAADGSAMRPCTACS